MAFRAFRRVVVPGVGAGTSCSLVWSSVVYAKEEVKNENVQETGVDKTTPRKPSELPIYENSTAVEYYHKPKTAVHDLASDVRKKCVNTAAEYQGTVQYVSSTCQDCIDKTKDVYKDLCGKASNVDNTQFRLGAIAGGGLIGALLGYKGGAMRKLFLATLGSGSVATVLYPDEALRYGNITYCFIRESTDDFSGTARKYGSIAYNFVVGPKSDKCNKPCPPPAAPKPPVEECPTPTETPKEEEKKPCD